MAFRSRSLVLGTALFLYAMSPIPCRAGSSVSVRVTLVGATAGMAWALTLAWADRFLPLPQPSPVVLRVDDSDRSARGRGEAPIIAIPLLVIPLP